MSIPPVVTTLKRRKTSRLSSVPVSEKVKLERVLGLTANSSAALSADIENGLIAYPAGCTIVLYSGRKNRQCHIINTSKKCITCLTFSSDGRYLATGESGHQPRVRVWDVHNDSNQVAELSDHKFSIVSVAFSPNGNYLVSVGNQHDMTVNVWNWKTNGKAASNKVSCKVKALSFVETGDCFVTVGVRHVKFWYMERKKGAKLQDTIPLLGRSAILADQRNNTFCDVACGRGLTATSTFCITQSGLLCEFNGRRILEKWVELRVRSAHALVLGSELLFVGCSDGIVRVFGATTLSFVATLPLPHWLGVDVASSSLAMSSGNNEKLRFPDVVALCYEPKHCKLTSIYADHSLYQWDVNDFSNVGRVVSFLYHSGSVWSVEVFCGDDLNSPLPNDTFVTCGNDDTIRLWNIDANMAYNPFYKRNNWSQELLKTLYVDSELLSLCDADTTSSEKSDSERRNGVRVIKISPNGQDLASGDRKGNLRMFRLADSSIICEIEAHDGEVLTLEYSNPNTGYNLLVSGSRDRMMHVLASDDNYEPLMSIEGHSAAVIAAKFGLIQKELFLISCGCDRMIVFHKLTFDPEPQFCRTQCIAAQMVIYDMELDLQTRHIYAACQDRQIRVYDVNDGKVKKTFKAAAGDDGTLLKLALDSSGHFAASSCSDKTLAVFNAKSGDCEALMCGHGEVSTGLKFSADFRRLIAVSGDSCVFVWRLSADLSDKLLALSRRRTRGHQISLGDDMLSTTDDDQSLVDEPIDSVNSYAQQHSLSTVLPNPQPKPRGKWARGSAVVPLPPNSVDGDELRLSFTDSDSNRKQLIGDDRRIEDQSVFVSELANVTQRMQNSLNFGSLANMRLVGGEEEIDQTPKIPPQPMVYADTTPTSPAERQFEVKERALDGVKPRAYGRTDTFGNEISDEDDDISGVNTTKDSSYSSGQLKDSHTCAANESFKDGLSELASGSNGSGFDRNGSARLSITSKYLLKNRSYVDTLQKANPTNSQTTIADDKPRPQQRAKWPPRPQIITKVTSSSPPDQSQSGCSKNSDTPTPHANSGGVLWSYKMKTPTRTPTSSVDNTPTTPKAVAEPESLLKIKKLPQMPNSQDRRQSMPDYSCEGSMSSPVESAVDRGMTRWDSRSSIISSCSTFAMSKSLVGENMRPGAFSALPHYKKFDAGGSLCNGEKFGTVPRRRLPTSLSMGSLAHHHNGNESNAVSIDSNKIARQTNDLKQKLRKSQENLSRFGLSHEKSPQKAKSYCSLTPHRSDFGVSLDRSDGRNIAATLMEARGLARSISNLAATNSATFSDGNSTSSSRYRKVTTPVSGVQKKLFQLKARYSGSSVDTGHVDLNAQSSDEHSLVIGGSSTPRTLPPIVNDGRARRSTTPLGLTTPIRANSTNPSPSKDDSTAPRRTSYLARLLADEGAQQQNSDCEKTMEACVAPEIFDGAHFEKMSAHCRETAAEFRTFLDKILHAHRLVQNDADLTQAEKSVLLATLCNDLSEARRRLDQTLTADSGNEGPAVAAPADAFLQQYSDALLAMIQQKMATSNAGR